MKSCLFEKTNTTDKESTRITEKNSREKIQVNSAENEKEIITTTVTKIGKNIRDYYGHP